MHQVLNALSCSIMLMDVCACPCTMQSSLAKGDVSHILRQENSSAQHSQAHLEPGSGCSCQVHTLSQPTLTKGASASLASRRAISVFPQPVGPIMRMFLGTISSCRVAHTTSGS